MSVQIIAHRGWWTKPEEQNTLTAFARAFDAGIGVELDVRDHDGFLVVRHDPPEDSYPDVSYFRLQEVLDLLGDRPNTLAVNVKSCGLAPLFEEQKAPKNWFFFDVATPEEEREYRLADLPVWRRLGMGYERHDSLMILSTDLFSSIITRYMGQWAAIKASQDDHEYSLLTDKPFEAMEFFK